MNKIQIGKLQPGDEVHVKTLRVGNLIEILPDGDLLVAFWNKEIHEYEEEVVKAEEIIIIGHYHARPNAIRESY